MNEYEKFQKQQTGFEAAASDKHETLGVVLHWGFLLVGATISAGASFFIGHQGMRGNLFYEWLFGSEKSALLVVALLEGSFLALCVGLATFLKSQKQREIARGALLVLKIVLVTNILAAFLQVQGIGLRWISAYVTFGAPLVIGGTIWLWSSLFSYRHKNLMMASALDTQAQKNEHWRQQYLSDQERNRAAYELAANSPPMAALRNQVAETKAIRDIAREFNISEAEARQIYLQARAEREGRASREAWRDAIEEPPHPSLPSRIN